MKTYAATLTVILRPGAAGNANEADAVLRRILGEHPEVLAGQYAKVGGELKAPRELEIDPPALPRRPGCCTPGQAGGRQ
jgi:hypothetical protein